MALGKTWTINVVSQQQHLMGFQFCKGTCEGPTKPFFSKGSVMIISKGWTLPGTQRQMIFLPVLTGPVSDTTREMIHLRWAFHGASYRSWGTGLRAPGVDLHCNNSTHWRIVSFHQGQQDAEEVGSGNFFLHLLWRWDMLLIFFWGIVDDFPLVFDSYVFFKHATIWSLIVAQKSHRLDLFFNTKSMEEAIT